MISRYSQRGVVLLALLISLAICGLSIMIAADVAILARKRERERQLLFVGDQFRRAVAHYYYSAPVGQARILPKSVDDLLLDSRYPVPVRHLRKVFLDPITGDRQWEYVRLGGGIAGVKSISEENVLKKEFFPPVYSKFEEASTYQDWIFVFVPPGVFFNQIKKTP